MSEKHDSSAHPRQRKPGRDALTDESLQQVMTEWPQVIARVRAELDRGTDPTDASVRSLAERWMDLVKVLTGDDPGLETWLRVMHQQEPGGAAKHGVDPRLFGYIGRAMACLDEPE